MQYVDETDEQVVTAALQSQLTPEEWDTLKAREAALGHPIEAWLEELTPATEVFSNVLSDGQRVVGFTCNLASHRYPEAHLVVIDIIRAFCSGASLIDIEKIATVVFPAEHREVVNVWDALLEVEYEQAALSAQ